MESVGRVSAESGLFIDGCSGWASCGPLKFSVQTLSLADLHVGKKPCLVDASMTGAEYDS